MHIMACTEDVTGILIKSGTEVLTEMHIEAPTEVETVIHIKPGIQGVTEMHIETCTEVVAKCILMHVLKL